MSIKSLHPTAFSLPHFLFGYIEISYYFICNSKPLNGGGWCWLCHLVTQSRLNERLNPLKQYVASLRDLVTHLSLIASQHTVFPGFSRLSDLVTHYPCAASTQDCVYAILGHGRHFPGRESNFCSLFWSTNGPEQWPYLLSGILVFRSISVSGCCVGLV